MIRPYICVGTTLIISLFVFCQLGFWSAVAVGIAAICCSALFFFLRNKNRVLNTVFICFLALLMSSSAFITKTVTDYQPAMLAVSEDTRTITGTLYEYEEEYGKFYYTLTDVRINGIQTRAKIRVSTENYKNAAIDDIITVTDATVYELGSSSSNQNSYKANGIYLGAYTSSAIESVSAEKHSVNYYFECIRQYISDSLKTNMNPKYAAVADAMLTGNQSDIDDETLLNFRYSGIAHLFAVSGFHLSLWTSALSVFLNKVLGKNKYIGNIVCILFVIFFMALTGFTKSVVRAGIMLIILLFGRIINYQSEPINSLFIAVTIILMINPFAVMSVSLQMSFLSTLGILILADPVTHPVQKLKDRIKSKFLYNTLSASYMTVMISIIASLFTMPVSAMTFGYVSIAAPLTNLLCMLPSQAVMILSGINVLTVKIPFISKPLSFIGTLLTRYIISVTDKISSRNHSVMDTSSPTLQIILMTIIIIMAITLIIFRKDAKKLRNTLFCIAASVAVISLCTVSVQSSSVKISVADVGNGMSIVMRTRDRNFIIGCGGNTYRSYKLTNITDKNTTLEYDLLLIPRNKTTENEFAYKLLQRYDFDSCIISDDDYPSYITDMLPHNTVFTDECSIKLDENIALDFIESDELSSVRIESENFTCTILFRALSDVPQEWQSGSLLITRQSLPDFDLSDFENIIVSSSKEVIYDNENIYTTKYSGQIDYRMYPIGSSTITEEKHDY